MDEEEPCQQPGEHPDDGKHPGDAQERAEAEADRAAEDRRGDEQVPRVGSASRGRSVGYGRVGRWSWCLLCEREGREERGSERLMGSAGAPRPSNSILCIPQTL
jgi:hypothetical protein